MSTHLSSVPGRLGLALAFALTLASTSVSARVLDDFDDNTKTDWTDFTFVPGFGLPSETGGQFQFDLPSFGDDIFTASQKTSEVFELKEGRTIEFRVDVAASTGEDAYAVLAFIPNTGGNNPGTLGGYGLAKDPTDVLITKGVEKYFVADDGVTAELKNEDITLSLTLTVEEGNVIITGKVIDRSDSSILWERTVTDTPAADVMEDGTDDPAVPYITTGYFTLYCYQQFNEAIGTYTVSYDNAEVFVVDAPVTSVLDDFNDNTKTDWTDFTFVPGFGLPSETGGQFQFDLPSFGDDIFTASQKTSRVFDLVTEQHIEFRVDVVASSGEDAYAVLAFIPNTGGNNPGTLGGYGLAKDPTDVLITKGVEKYFVADDGPTAELPNENITLVLSLDVDQDQVTITGKVIDRSDGSVLWERTVVDTPAADVMADGTDDPAAPYITTGYFTLYCYQQFNEAIGSYTVFYDNATVVAPPLSDNVAPIITDVQPADYANFQPTSTEISFRVRDDKDLVDEGISVVLNGVEHNTANGLGLTGTGTNRIVTLTGLTENVDYHVTLRAVDSEGLVTERLLRLDTFRTDNLVIEVEDYNFEGGQFIDNPIASPEQTFSNEGYSWQRGIPDVDYSDTRPVPNPPNIDDPNTPYRIDDPVRMQHTFDHARPRYLEAGGSASFVWDYDVGDIATNEWLNYTRTFPAGHYEVYLRESLANMSSGESTLELVTGDRTQTNQTTTSLGSFLGRTTGFQYGNFALTDGTGLNKQVLQLSGVTTFKLRQITPDPADGRRLLNYLVFRPVPDPGSVRPVIVSLSPPAGGLETSVRPSIRVVIENRDSTVQTDSIVLAIDDAVVPATVTPGANGAVVTYDLSPLPPTGSVVTARISYTDSDDVPIETEWSFTLAYKALDSAHRRSGPGITRGFNVRMVQAPIGSNLENSLLRAEAQLAPDSTIPKAVDTTVLAELINFSEAAGSTNGSFPDDALIPGLGTAGTDDIAMEITAYVELAAGVYRFGANCDDGYKVQGLADFEDRNAPPLAFHNGGPANETYDFVVPISGFYPMRMVWYERDGAAHVEWFSVDLNTDTRVLLNAADASGIAVYSEVEPEPAVELFSSATILGSYSPETEASIDPGTRTITIAPSGTMRFYRLRAATALTITEIQSSGGQIVISY
jgi:hypothetical protein